MGDRRRDRTPRGGWDPADTAEADGPDGGAFRRWTERFVTALGELRRLAADPRPGRAVSAGGDADLLVATWYLESRRRLACTHAQWWDPAVPVVAVQVASGHDQGPAMRRLGAARGGAGFDEIDVRDDLAALVGSAEVCVARRPDVESLVDEVLAGWRPAWERRTRPLRVPGDADVIMTELESCLDRGSREAPSHDLLVVDTVPGGLRAIPTARVAPAVEEVGVRALSGVKALGLIEGARFGFLVPRAPATREALARFRHALHTAPELEGIPVWTWLERLPADPSALPGFVDGLRGVRPTPFERSTTRTRRSRGPRRTRRARSSRGRHGVAAPTSRRFELARGIERLAGVAAVLVLFLAVVGGIWTQPGGPQVEIAPSGPRQVEPAPDGPAAGAPSVPPPATADGSADQAGSSAQPDPSTTADQTLTASPIAFVTPEPAPGPVETPAAEAPSPRPSPPPTSGAGTAPPPATQPSPTPSVPAPGPGSGSPSKGVGKALGFDRAGGPPANSHAGTLPSHAVGTMSRWQTSSSSPSTHLPETSRTRSMHW